MVAETGALEVVLEAMRIHHFTSAAVRLAGVQVSRLDNVASHAPW